MGTPCLMQTSSFWIQSTMNRTLPFSRRLSIVILFLIVAIPHLAAAQDKPAERVFRAGAATSNITPPLGEPIVGGFVPYPSQARPRRAARPLPGAGRRPDEGWPSSSATTSASRARCSTRPARLASEETGIPAREHADVGDAHALGHQRPQREPR